MTQQKQERLDVARIMRKIRSETRVHNEEIARRIERAHKQIEEQIPQVLDSRLYRLVRAQREAFDRYYDRMVSYLTEQEPNYANIRRTLAELNRLIAEPSLAPGPRDRWWNPRWWLKRALGPIRRFVLRGQNTLNALMRDTLIYLFNHSAHIEAERLQLEMGIHLTRMMEILIEQIEVSRRYVQEWLRVTMPPIADYMQELHKNSFERQAEALSAFEEDMARRLEQFAADWRMRLDRVTAPVQGGGLGKTAGTIGFDTLRFADSLRGSPEELRRQQAHYVEHFRDQQNVLDAGCGRGEFLELLRDNGISAYGVDLDENMVRYCRERGLDVRLEDVVDHLAGLPDDSLGGVVAFQVIEHLDFPSLFQMFRLAARKVRSQGVILLETVNPTCLTTFSGAFYADPTHQHPVHPEAVRRMLEVVGFGDVRIEYLNPIEESDKLQLLPADPSADPAMRRLVDTFNQNIRLINSLLYNYADYAVIGRKTV